VKRTSWLLPAALLAVWLATANSGRAGRSSEDTSARPERSPSGDESALNMTPAVACAEIKGFEDYEPLPGAALTSDEKLLVYYRPLNYKVAQAGATNHIHLVQDGQIRRRGEKKVLHAKNAMLDYDWKSREPANPVFLRNTVSLKGLMPGEYDYDIILHDRLAPDAPAARQTLPFKVIPPGPRNDQGEAKPSGDRPTSP
jgi:hypothetical protein